MDKKMQLYGEILMFSDVINKIYSTIRHHNVIFNFTKKDVCVLNSAINNLKDKFDNLDDSLIEYLKTDILQDLKNLNELLTGLDTELSGFIENNTENIITPEKADEILKTTKEIQEKIASII